MLKFIYARIVTVIDMLRGISRKQDALDRRIADLEREIDQSNAALLKLLDFATQAQATLAKIQEELTTGPAAELNLTAGPIEEQP